MKAVEQLWADLQKCPFPRGMAGQVAGVRPTQLNVLATGCVRAFLANGGRLDVGEKATLGRCLSDLRRLNPELAGEEQVYFGKLYRVCDLVYGKA